MASLALMAVDNRTKKLETARSSLELVTYPIQSIASLPHSLALWFAEVFATKNHLQRENNRLHREHLLLQAGQQKLEALEAENMRLRNLLESSFKIGERVLIAELIAVDLDPYRQQLVINKGRISGVFIGQPVLDANAVMGQVIHVNRLRSTVLMITDASHALPVQVNRTGLRTIAMGTGHINLLILPYLPNNADIIAGDLLVTSGLGGRFPAGYPVAKVSSVSNEPGAPFASIQARPSAHLDRSREVLLVWPLTPPEQIEISTQAGSDQVEEDAAP